MTLPSFPARLLTTTICPSWRSIICGRTALVKEMVPTAFKSKSALSTSNDVFSTKAICPLPALFTRMSTCVKKTNVLVPAASIASCYSAVVSLDFIFLISIKVPKTTKINSVHNNQHSYCALWVSKVWKALPRELEFNKKNNMCSVVCI